MNNPYKNYRAGFAAVVGRPNVGKSTLTNALVGQKVAITSNQPETTRHSIRGVAHAEGIQLVLVDTPGLHKPRTLLGKRLNDTARESLADVDAVIFCLPANQHVGPGDRFIANELKDLKIPVVAVVTKADLASPERLAEALIEVNELGDWEAVLPLSAKLGRLGDLWQVMKPLIPLSPPLYPENQISDESVEKMIAELVREAALEGVRDELPHSIAVVVEEILVSGENYSPQLGYGILAQTEPVPDSVAAPEERGGTALAAAESEHSEAEPKTTEDIIVGKRKQLKVGSANLGDGKPLDVHVNVYVERPSQRAIMIGKGGSHIRRVRIRSRRQIQYLLGCPVNLDLHVRVAKNWQSDPKLMGRLGF